MMSRNTLSVSSEFLFFGCQNIQNSTHSKTMATDTPNSSQPPRKKLKFAGGKTSNIITLLSHSPHGISLTHHVTVAQEKPMARQNETISLLPTEQLLRQLLLDCRNDMQHRRSVSSSSNSELEIWFAGGWVKDKLLGIQSSDIDIALSTMTGV